MAENRTKTKEFQKITRNSKKAKEKKFLGRFTFLWERGLRVFKGKWTRLLTSLSRKRNRKEEDNLTSNDPLSFIQLMDN